MSTRVELAIGTCDRCGKSGAVKQYHPSSSKLLCADCRSKKWRKYRKMSPEERRVYERDRNHKLRVAVIRGYGGRCNCCSEGELLFLTIDHVNNDGNVERETLQTSKQLYQKLIRENFPEGYQVLCWNCNQGKRFLGICPHKARDAGVISEAI